MSIDQAVLQLMLTPGLGTKTLAALLLRLADGPQQPQEIVALPPADLARAYKLRPDVASAIASTHDRAAELAETLDDHDVHTLVIGSKEYPQRLIKVLGTDAPPILFAQGNLAILSQPTIGISGSRHVSQVGLKAAKAAASVLATAGVNIASGYANGVDLAAHQIALEVGGTTTFVLAEGILNFRAKGEIANHLGATNHVVISEFSPSLRWIARNAMQRNRTIIGVSDGLLVVEAGEDGGTFAAGEEALVRHSKLFVLSHSLPNLNLTGNQMLIHKGGNAVHVDEAGQIDLGDALNYVLSPSSQTDHSELRQGRLL